MTLMTLDKRRTLGVGLPQRAHDEYAQLCRDFEVHVVQQGPREEVKTDIARLCSEHGSFEAMFMMFANGSYSPIDEGLLAPLWEGTNNIRVLAQCGSGYDNVDADCVSRHGCYLTNTPQAVVESTADFTVFLFSAVLRGSTYCEDYARQGMWRSGLEMTTDPAGLILGVIGMGGIGKDFFRKVRVFGVSIIYHTRTRLEEDVEEAFGLQYASKEELLRVSDVVVCLCPGTKETYHLMETK